MDQLNGHILEVVQETLNPESVSLWIFTPGKQPPSPARWERPPPGAEIDATQAAPPQRS